MRMTGWKRAVTQTAAGSLALLLLAGCGGGAGTTSSDVSAPVGDVSTSATEDTTTTTTTGSQTTADEQKNSTKKPTTTTTTASTKSTRKTVATTTKQQSSKVDLSMYPVTPKLTIQQAAAKVNNKLSSTPTKIASEYALVDEYDPNWAFVHQQGLAVFKGKLYASYSRGKVDEDAPGQRVEVCSMSLSGSFGNWSEPTVVAPTTKDEMCNMNGFMVATDEKLIVYYTEKIYGPDSFDNQGNYKNYQENSPMSSRAMMVFTTDGKTWSEPVQVGIAANESPRQSLNGQWFAGAGGSLLFCEDTKLDGFSLSYLGMTDTQRKNSLARGNLRYLTESSWYQTDDYIIHHMFRSDAGYIWMSESYDNGKTWTEAYQTNFTSESTMANFGRLPDGRIYFVGSATNDGRRYPLSLYLSEDGYNFNKAYILRDEKYEMQKYGWAKGGYFAYPEVLIHGDYMYIHYSKQKEVSEVTRVKLSDIK